MYNNKQALEFSQRLYQDVFHKFDLKGLANYYHKDTKWHSCDIELDYETQYDYFRDLSNAGVYSKPDILKVVPSEKGLITWVIHNHFTADEKKILSVNTMVNIELKDDKISHIDFMWDLPTNFVMPKVKQQLYNTPLLEIEELLTAAEMKSFLYAIRGYSARMIAEKLFRSIRTIETHFESIKHKLGLVKISEASEYAFSKGFLVFAPIIKSKHDE